MVLRWINGANNTQRTVKPPRNSTVGKASAKRSSRKHNSGYVDSSMLGGNFGESELNAILEEVCDAVMPRKPSASYKPPTPAPSKLSLDVTSNTPSRSDIPPLDKHEVPWSDLMAQLGAEIAVSLADAMARVQDIARIHPQAAPALAAVLTRVEHSKRAAMIAQQFAHLRSARNRAQAETLSLREVVSQAIEQRATWLQRRGVQARMGLTDAYVHADAAALFSLVDELVNWAGGLSVQIGFGFDEISPQRSARLQVLARTDTAALDPATWQNMGWFLWHQLAGTLGAKADLEVTENALCVSVIFPPVPDPTDTTQTNELVLDHDIASIVAGCRVVLIAPEIATREAATQALGNLRLDVRSTWSVLAAREALGNSVPHAVVYDSCLDPGEILQLRSDLGTKAKVAYVELSNTTGPDFHVSSLGSLSTAHVSINAIRQSLAPALVFELCKVI